VHRVRFHVLRLFSFLAVPRARGSVFMFFTPELIFGGTEGVGFRFHVLRNRTRFRRYGGSRFQFHVLRARTHFRRYRGCRVPFSCFALSDSFSTVPRVSGPIFMFCAPRLVFSGTEGVRLIFHVLRSRTYFRRYRGHSIPFSCFALSTTRFSRFRGSQVPFYWIKGLDLFSLVPRASGPYFMFCTPGLVSGGTDGVGYCFHVLLSGLVLSGTEGVGSRFHVLLPGLIFGGTDSVGSSFHVLRARTHFRLYRGRRVPFSCYALPNSFSAVPRAFDLVFKFCATGLVFGGTEGIGSSFHVLRARTHFRRYGERRVPFSHFARPNSFSAVPRACGPVFMFCARRLIFGCSGDIGSHFHAFLSPYSFSVVPRAPGLIFMFCAPRLVFGGAEGVGSRSHVLRYRTHFRRYQGCRVPFSCFARPGSFSAVPRASGPVLMFCAPGLIFGVTEGVGSRFRVLRARFVGTEGVGSHFHVLRSRTRFRRYRGRLVPFSCFALPDSFSMVPRASGPFFMFFCLRTHFRWYRGRRVRFSCFALLD
jgi:hypothetical protein